MVRALQILFPLYIYPDSCGVSRDACAWKPLYDTVEANPGIQFNVVVNPGNGPGANAFPDSNYIAAVSTLNAHVNVKTIGYVASTKGARPVSEYQADVSKYAGWAAYSGANIAMHGIFVDEANNTPATLQYYTAFSNYIRSAFPSSDALVVLNPGTTTSQSYFDAMPNDVFVTFENFYSQMWEPFTAYTDSNFANTPHQRQAAIIHDFTGSTTDLVNVTDTTGEITDMKYIFVATQGDYNSFPTNWASFVAAVSGTNNWMAQHPDWYP
ncbi:hypothetical protein EXIGLDRAFT_648144 [Exidia glandulosa HHB12029]|uniref:Spherulation-specific family 4 n=1 Tax=Exidia glandulosa HHB12029 TaxID=1314781 RepID=A0A165H797_EXIGL|nr:hypothetical protein EXIGLDRAFT_648144 [Exidia glandulosa HHB12029]